VKLHNISFANQPHPERPKRHPVINPDLTPDGTVFFMHMLVHDSSLRSEPVFLPYLLYMDQSTLAGTECVVLQGREHDEIVGLIKRLRLY
jgi:hypothetical protein